MQTRRFSVMLEPGVPLSRPRVERVLADHNQATGEHFEVVWDAPNTERALAGTVHEFRLPTLDGEIYDFGTELGRRPVVLTFWASWCAPCLAEAPHLQALHSELGDRVAVVGVSVDEPSKHAALAGVVKRLGLTYPIALDADGAVYASFHPGGSIPTTVVLDAAGEVTFVSNNFETGDDAKLRAAVAEVVSN